MPSGPTDALLLACRYKAEEKRQPVIDAMNLLLPMMYQRMCELMPDISENAVLLQKQVLKILRSYLLHQLPLEHVSPPRRGADRLV